MTSHHFLSDLIARKHAAGRLTNITPARRNLTPEEIAMIDRRCALPSGHVDHLTQEDRAVLLANGAVR